MEQLKVIQYLEANKDYLFPNDEFDELELEDILISAPDECEKIIKAIPFRNPKTVKLISFFVGALGVDRLYLEDKKNALVKYFTFGGLGVWWIKDIISSKERCRIYNCNKLLNALENPNVVTKMHNIDKKIAIGVGVTSGFAEGVAKGVKERNSRERISRTFYIK